MNPNPAANPESMGRSNAADHAERFWRGRIRRTRRRLAAGWWSSVFVIWLIPAAVLAGTGLWLLRWWGQTPAPGLVLAAIAVVLLVPALVATVLTLRRRVDDQTALVRLETRVGTRGRLAGAFAGVTAWPPLPAAVDDGLYWRWSRLATPVLAALGLLAAGWWLPLPGLSPAGAAADPTPPLTWEQMEHALDLLEEHGVSSDEALENWREQLESLTSRDAGEWFAHSTLEASDHLQASLEQAVRELQQHMTEAAASMNALQQLGENLSEQARDALAAELGKALEAMESGALPLDPELLAALAEHAQQLLDQLQSIELTPEQWQELQQRMAECMAAMQCATEGGECNAAAVAAMMEALANAGIAPAPGEEGMDQAQAWSEVHPGTGGPMDTGPGHTPLTLREQPTHLRGSQPQPLAPGDPDRFIPGDAIGEGLAEHDIDTSPATPQAGGQAAGGQGGGRMEVERLLPAEQEVVRRFFDGNAGPTPGQ